LFFFHFPFIYWLPIAWLAMILEP